MTLLDHLQPDVTREEVNAALDAMIKAQAAYDEAILRWAAGNPICVALAADLAKARWTHQQMRNRFYGKPRVVRW